MGSIAIRQTGRTVVRVVTIVFLLGFAVAQLFPLLWLAIYSLQRSSDLFGPELLRWPSDPQWGNYVRAWVDGRIVRYFFNSLIVVGVAVVAVTVCAFLLSYSVARMRWRGRRLVYGFVMLGMVIPIHTTLLPNFLWFNRFGLIDTYAGLVIPYVAFNLSFSVLMFAGLLSSIPYSMEDSAFMDGARMTTTLTRIIAPMVRTGFVTVGVMAFLSGWNEFIMANTFLASESKRTLPFSIIRFEGQYSSDYAVQFAVMVIVALIPILLYFLFSRWVVAGVTAGAVKE